MFDWQAITTRSGWKRRSPGPPSEHVIPAVQFPRLLPHVLRGVPEHMRSDNGPDLHPEFTAGVVREWLKNAGGRTLYIEPGSPWENGYCESFNGKFRDELLNRECLNENWFLSLDDAREKVEAWRQDYNNERPHSALGQMAPARYAMAQQPGAEAAG